MPSARRWFPVDADPVADEAALGGLAAWCERYTPMAAPDPPDGLWLDITGCTAVFATEAELVQDLAVRLERNGIPCRLAVAGTTGAAWALAHAGEDRMFCRRGRKRRRWPNCRSASLRLDAGMVTGLRRLGLRTVQDLLRIPRAQITSRFGAIAGACGWIRRWAGWRKRSIGRARRSIGMSVWPSPNRSARQRTWRAPCRSLPKRLCRRLAEQDKGGQRFVARFFRVDDVVPQIAVTTALPVRDAAYLAKLLREKLDTRRSGLRRSR